ncbi:MAG: alpha/beta hydrolase [Alphaproteobacteria bacterium TMED93]|nr:MAG: alpha/beta hydrolase [Alphaproteobacteria bacterium TMED93]
MNVKNLEQSFNPRLAVPNFESYLRISKEKAKLAEKKLTGKTDISYGDSKLQTLDVFYKDYKDNLPIHIFIHGGYWRALDKSYHTHMAVPFFEKEICFFNINYELCPKVKLTEIREQIIKAIVWIYENAYKFNANNKNIVLSGHSAGAHLASLMLNVDWKKYGLNDKYFKGIALISGIFDTEIVTNLNVNKEIGLSLEEAIKNNLFKLKPLYVVPTIISYGKNEPTLWKEQSYNYMNYLNLLGFNCKKIVCENDNHFSLIETLADNNKSIVKEIINLSLTKQ